MSTSHRIGSHLPHPTRRYLPFDPREEMFAKSPRCRYCGRHFKYLRNSTADHIIPVAKGGEINLRNLALCCRSCNTAKDDRTPWELFRWACRVLLVFIIARVEGGTR